MLLPKSFREAVGIEAGGLARVEVRGGEVVLAPVKGAAERFYGLARVAKWPGDLDESIVRAVRELWRERPTST